MAPAPRTGTLCCVLAGAGMQNMGQKEGGRKELPGANEGGKSQWAGAGEKTGVDGKPGGSETGRTYKM